MPDPLQLTLTDYVDATRWRWVLNDARGRFLADHSVRLDPTGREHAGFLDLGTYLDYHQPAYPIEQQLAALGLWVGEQVFGGLQPALWQKHALPAVAVRVCVPETAAKLLSYPFELACFADGRRFTDAGLRFVYEVESMPPAAGGKEPAEKALRILAVFSLPARTNPLNLRRERYGLQRLARELSQTQQLAVDLRVLQYGATRQTLREALEEAEGWDVIHLSGHGNRGELLLEDERGEGDPIAAAELGDLLEPACAHLKLLILDACYSGVGSHAAARAQLGLDREPERQAAGEPAQAATASLLPGLAETLVRRLDCAALAMRYPVGDGFATDLMLAFYRKLLDRRQPLPAALNLAQVEALAAKTPLPALSPVTPILVGPRAATLCLAPPAAPGTGFVLPRTGLGIGFPPEPERFVGRIQPMLRAGQAFAPGGARRGVLFYGMPGAGKTACALELAYRYAERRFQGCVWYRAPEADREVAGELQNFLFEIERQLNAPDLGLTTALADPERFRRFTLPRLRAFLHEHSFLFALDNLETLLTSSDRWRDPLWGEVMAALLSHDGPSRVVLTARRLPADLASHPRLQVEAIHALSFAESVLLAHELPYLGRLFADDAGRELLQQTLRVAQGHPKLLELADGLAADRGRLAERVAAAARELAGRGEILDAFFAVGGEREGESRQGDAEFVGALEDWTAGVTAGLSPTARLLFAFLCRLEPEDRQGDIVEANWKDFLTRLGDAHPDAAAALAVPGAGLPGALAELEAAGLLAAERPALDAVQVAELQGGLADQGEEGGVSQAAQALQDLLPTLAARAATYTIHPGVAEAARSAAAASVLAAADVELGNLYVAVYGHALETEMQGGGRAVVASVRRAAPYLMRQTRWNEAATLLQSMLQRDSSPAALAFALPLLRRTAAETVATAEGLQHAGVLARALRSVGSYAEAEAMLRVLIAQRVERGDYRGASVSAGDLLNLFMDTGRLPEALALAEEAAGYTRQAGLGPWTQLSYEVFRLQVLAQMGRDGEVLDAVARLRPRMDALPLDGQAEESAVPWNARETLLDTGHTAALRSERWEQALSLTAAILESQNERGADALDLAHTRFNDYGPLLRLGRFAEARALLRGCRDAFEAARDVEGLGRVYGALADLEDRTGGREAAVRFAKVALGYTYRAIDPQDPAIGHNNLASYLARQGADAALVLAHRLAAATIRHQMQSGYLRDSLRNLAGSSLPLRPPSFADVAARVEAVEGVRFRELFARLPLTAPGGDAAIAAVWQSALQERQRREQEVLQQEAALASLPAAVRAALELEGEEAVRALRTALAALPGAEAEAALQRMAGAGLIGRDPDVEGALREFEPLLQAIAAVAKGDDRPRAEIEELLPSLAGQGWHLTGAVHRIWRGERDAAALTAGLDAPDSALVRRLLQLVGE